MNKSEQHPKTMKEYLSKQKLTIMLDYDNEDGYYYAWLRGESPTDAIDGKTIEDAISGLIKAVAEEQDVEV